MFEYTKSELAQKANELNFVRDTLEKVLRLSEILNYLNTNPLTRDRNGTLAACKRYLERMVVIIQ